MKKTLLAVTIAAAILTGCVSTSDEPTTYLDIKAQGQELLKSSSVAGYTASSIPDLEKVRLTVNSVFLLSQPLYERYTEQLQNTPELENFMAATGAVDTEEEKKAIYDQLTPEHKIIVDKFLNSSVVGEVMERLGEVSLVIMNNTSTFNNLDTASLLQQVDFSNLMTEKDLIAHTGEQVIYLNDSIYSLYKNYQIISAFSNAQ